MSIYDQIHTHTARSSARTNVQKRSTPPEGLRRPAASEEQEDLTIVLVSLCSPKADVAQELNGSN